MPDADALNAPEGALLRADNLVLDEIGALALRRGSSKLYSGLPDADIHTLRTLELAGFEGTPGTRRFIGAGDKLYVDGMAAGATFDGSGDRAIGSGPLPGLLLRGGGQEKA